MAQKFVTVHVKKKLCGGMHVFFFQSCCFVFFSLVFVKKKLNYARIKLGFSALGGMTQ